MDIYKFNSQSFPILYINPLSIHHMRVLRPVLFALTTSLVSIHANTGIHPHKRAVLDTCANIDAGLGLLGMVNANLKLCLCLSALPTAISANAQLAAAADILGTSAVTAALTALVCCKITKPASLTY